MNKITKQKTQPGSSSRDLLGSLLVTFFGRKLVTSIGGESFQVTLKKLENKANQTVLLPACRISVF